MKKSLFFIASLIMLLVTSCRKIEMDGETVYVNNPGSGGTAQTITLKGRIDSNMTLTKQNTYLLQGKVYIVGNHTLKVEAGTVIKGS